MTTLARTGRIAAITCVLLIASCKEELYTKLDQTEVNQMLAVLERSGISADKVAAEEGTFKLEVDKSDFSKAVDVLRLNGLPEAKFASMGDVFKKDGLVTTANAERMRYMYAMSQELSNTLSRIDGVVTARVHPVLPENDPLAEKVTPSSAAVLIKYRAGANLRVLSPAIKELVTNSIEGLAYDKVAITFVPTQSSEQLMSSANPTASVIKYLLIGMAIVSACGLLLLGIMRMARRADGDNKLTWFETVQIWINKAKQLRGRTR